MNRRGLIVIRYEYCRQYEEFCKGFFLHQSGKVKEALLCYTSSLDQGGVYSDNRLRLESLEAIELVIREKAKAQMKEYQIKKKDRKFKK